MVHSQQGCIDWSDPMSKFMGEYVNQYMIRADSIRISKLVGELKTGSPGYLDHAKERRSGWFATELVWLVRRLVPMGTGKLVRI